MDEAVNKALLNLRTRQESGEYTLCPRCGQDTMKPVLTTNAHSRHAEGIYICDQCGTTEAMLDFMRNPLPLQDWAVFAPDRPKGDFRNTESAAAWKEISAEQVPFLIRLYERWLDDPTSDFRAYRDEARKMCKGLTDIWSSPFHVTYETADGTILIRFKNGDDVQIAWDIIPNGGKTS